MGVPLYLFLCVFVSVVLVVFCFKPLRTLAGSLGRLTWLWLQQPLEQAVLPYPTSPCNVLVFAYYDAVGNIDLLILPGLPVTKLISGFWFGALSDEGEGSCHWNEISRDFVTCLPQF